MINFQPVLEMGLLRLPKAALSEILTAQASYIAKAYKMALEEHTSKIKSFCRLNDIDFVSLGTDELLSSALLGFLNKRQRMR